MRKSQLAIGLTIFEILNNEKGIPKSMQSIIFELANRKVIDQEISKRTFARYIKDLNEYLPFNIQIEYVTDRTNGYIIKDLDKKAISDAMTNKRLNDPVVRRALENALSSRTFSDISQAQKLLQDNFGNVKHNYERFYSNEINSGLENINLGIIREAINEERNLDIEYIDLEGRHNLINITPLWIIHKPTTLMLYYYDKKGSIKNVSYNDLRYFINISKKEIDKGARFDFKNMEDYINKFGELKKEFKPLNLSIPENNFDSFYQILVKIDFPMFYSIGTIEKNKSIKFKHLSLTDRKTITLLANAFNGGEM